MENTLGKIIILNGTPRSGKSSIAAVIQETFDGVWINIGVDQFMQMTPKKFQPGIGLRPGGECPELEPTIKRMYFAMYRAIAEFSRLGLNVVVDVGHHDGYSKPLHILPECSRILTGLPAWLIGIRCPIEIIMERRINTWKVGYTKDGKVPTPVLLWQELVHKPGIYDLEVDTSIKSPEQCAESILQRMNSPKPPTALQQISK